MYLSLKNAHIIFIIISILLFNYRFLLKGLNKPVPKVLKIIPHINDTFLLVSGISLAYIAGFNPLQQSWLMAKIMALILYIIFGTMALKRTGAQSIGGYLFATSMIVFMVITAINKIPFLINI
jgi:uncharacterized membrane protein SirB2